MFMERLSKQKKLKKSFEKLVQKLKYQRSQTKIKLGDTSFKNCITKTFYFQKRNIFLSRGYRNIWNYPQVSLLKLYFNICGGGENRTPVRIRLMQNIYKLSFLIIVLPNFASGTKTKLNQLFFFHLKFKSKFETSLCL